MFTKAERYDWAERKAMARKTKEDAEKTRKDIIDSARAVFHQCGVSRSTLDKIAKEAGVTRGAVYWHFKDKAELFFAMRDDVFAPMAQRTDALLQSEAYDNPLDAIEASLKDFYQMLDDCAALREVFEIMTSRCEYVDEFACVQQDIARPGQEFLEKMERVYRKAAEKGFLREGLDVSAAAHDTWAFSSGLLHLMLSCQRDSYLDSQIPPMITTHMALRRRA
jgi:TetR/AcrR family acrAB operon transcriptional repressor